MTLLSIVRDASDMIGTSNRPSVVIGNNNVEVIKLLRYANQEGRELVRRGDWQALRSEQTFTSLAQETQTSMVASDLDHFINETFWNRTRKRPLFGPKTPQEWQTIKGAVTSAVVDTYTYRGSNILINPTPSADHTLAYEYVSNKFCQSSGGTAQSVWTADTDTGRLREELFILGIVWRYKMDAGLPYQPDAMLYNAQVELALQLDSPKQTIGMASGTPRYGIPGIVVPEGSWSP